MTQDQQFVNDLCQQPDERVGDPEIARFEDIDSQIDQFLNGLITRYELRVRIIGALCTEYK